MPPPRYIFDCILASLTSSTSSTSSSSTSSTQSTGSQAMGRVHPWEGANLLQDVTLTVKSWARITLPSCLPQLFAGVPTLAASPPGLGEGTCATPQSTWSPLQRMQEAPEQGDKVAPGPDTWREAPEQSNHYVVCTWQLQLVYVWVNSRA